MIRNNEPCHEKLMQDCPPGKHRMKLTCDPTTGESYYVCQRCGYSEFSTEHYTEWEQPRVTPLRPRHD